MLRVIVAGTRYFNSPTIMQVTLDHLLSGHQPDEVEIVSGRARGADRMGEAYARSRGYAVKLFPADWEKHGKSAGYKRNTQMAEYADALVAYWDNESRGTLHMINIARDLGLQTEVILYKEYM